MPSNHLIFCHPLLLPPSIFRCINAFPMSQFIITSGQKYWSFSFSTGPSNEYSGLISFRMDWLDLLAVQGTLKSLLQNHSSKASMLWYSALFVLQISHPYRTTGITITSTRQNFVGKVMPLLSNMLFRLVITFLQGANAFFFFLFNFMAAVTIYSDFGVPQNKVCHCFHCFPINLP